MNNLRCFCKGLKLQSGGGEFVSPDSLEGTTLLVRPSKEYTLRSRQSRWWRFFGFQLASDGEFCCCAAFILSSDLLVQVNEMPCAVLFVPLDVVMKVGFYLPLPFICFAAPPPTPTNIPRLTKGLKTISESF